MYLFFVQIMDAIGKNEWTKACRKDCVDYQDNSIKTPLEKMVYQAIIEAARTYRAGFVQFTEDYIDNK